MAKRPRRGDRKEAVRVVFAGTPETAVPSLKALLASSHEVVGVITRPDARAGRGRSLAESPVALCAHDAGVPVMKPVSFKDAESVAQLQQWAPDCVPIVAYGALIPGPALQIPPQGWVNLHFSLLPAWRGAAPVQRAVMHGDDVLGVSTFFLDEGLDTGKVIGQMTYEPGAHDSAGDILEALSALGADFLVRSLDAIAQGEVQAEPQPLHGASHAAKITVEEAQIAWNLPAYLVHRTVRGCSPKPGAWTMFRGERLKVVQTMPSSETGLSAGELRASKNAVLVGTGDGVLELCQVQPAGKKMMDGATWARGVRVETGEGLA
ncbi:ketimine reductase mu-crystallin [Platysternon megacephalum]|uniref:Methionyl-tRNA formyltransferase, mitochondrial n=1 Tax=Platysternon megacephalum TaxID=55544 RepID=A0A4D9DEZ6_9SAUR|nr:ketimine reductase mu-crystallin [Platysternon megacephalum]